MKRTSNLIDPTRSKFRYQRIAQQLRREIRAQYHAGDRFASEPDLCARLRVTRNTIRKALDLLAADGWIERHGRAGNYVTDAGDRGYDDRLFCVAMPIRNHLCDEIFLSLSHQGIEQERYALICDFSGHSVVDPFGQTLPLEQMDARLRETLSFRPRTLVMYAGELPPAAAQLSDRYRNLILLSRPPPPGFEHAGSVLADQKAGWRLNLQHAWCAGYRRLCAFVPEGGVHAPSLQANIAETPGAAYGLDRQTVLFENRPEWPEQMIALARQSSEPLAIVTSYDWGAHLARQVLDRAGIDIPRQVGIYGMNNTAWSLQDNLTSIKYDPELWAAEVFALDAALDAGANGAVRYVPPLLVQRGSTLPADVR